jgi:hypothetical protein
MDTQEQLFGLMAIAEEHQAAVRAAIAALAAERQLLGQQSEAHSKQLRELTKAATHAIDAMQTGAGDVTRVVVMRSLEQTSRAVASAFDDATKPVIEKLSASAVAVGNAGATLRTALAWLSWRWLALLATGAGGIVVAVWLSSLAMVEWQRYQIGALREERQVLAGDVDKLRAVVADLEHRGGRAELATCGNPGRLCIRVTDKGGYGEGRDFFVVKGY